MTKQNIQEDRLVLKAQSGDRRALDGLLAHYEIALFRPVYRIVGEEQEAYDTLQETFVAVAKSIRKLRSREKFKAWLYGVATRVALRSQSRHWRSPLAFGLGVEGADEHTRTYDIVLQKEQVDALMKEIETLSAPLRSVILLHYLEEFTLWETAKALELPLGTVKSRVAAGLAQLRERMGPSFENQEPRRAERDG